MPENSKGTLEFKGERMFPLTTVEGIAHDVAIEGQTLVVHSRMHRKNNTGEDRIVRTRLNPVGDGFVLNSQLSNGTFTLYNFTDKYIHFVGVTSLDAWSLSIAVEPKSSKVVVIPSDQCISGVDFRPGDGWDTSNIDAYTADMFMVVQGTWGESLPYDLKDGIINLGQGEGGISLTLVQPLEEPRNIKGCNIFKDRYAESNENNVNFAQYVSNDLMCVIYQSQPVEPDTEYVFEEANKNILQQNAWGLNLITNPMYTEPQYIRGNQTDKFSGVCRLRTHPDTRYLLISCNKNVIDDYKYYKSRTSELRIPYSFNKVNNSIKDEIVYVQDDPYLKRMTKELTITGNLNVNAVTKGASTTLIRIGGEVSDLDNDDRDITEFVCDKFKPHVIFKEEELSPIIEGIYLSISKNIYIRVHNDRLSTFDIAGAKALLNSLQPRIVYKVKTTYTRLEPMFFKLFGGTQKMFINTSIPPSSLRFKTTSSTDSKVDAIFNMIHKDKPVVKLDGATIRCEEGRIKFTIN